MPVSTVVAEAWRDILGVSEVHEEDDFFLVGGDSLLAVAMLSRINKLLGTEVPLGILVFEGSFGALVAACQAA